MYMYTEKERKKEIMYIFYAFGRNAIDSIAFFVNVRRPTSEVKRCNFGVKIW